MPESNLFDFPGINVKWGQAAGGDLSGTYPNPIIRTITGSVLINGSITLSGATSGTTTLQASAIAGTTTITFPAATDTVALLGTAQTFTAAKTFNDTTLKLAGVTSGTITVKAAAVAGTNTITLPAGTTDFSATGGTSQFVKQNSAGGALTVVRPATTDLSDYGLWATNTPTVTATGGTFTTVVGTQRWFNFGKLFHMIGSVTITTNGTASGQVVVTLPGSVSLTGSIVGCGRGNVVSGKSLVIYLASATTLAMTNYDFTYPGANGETLIYSIFAEIP